MHQVEWEFVWGWRCVQFASAWGAFIMYEDPDYNVSLEMPVLGVKYLPTYGEPQIQLDMGIHKPWYGPSLTLIRVVEQEA